MIDFILYFLVMIAVQLEAYHDWYRQYRVNQGTIYSNHADRVSKRWKALLLLIVWGIGLYFPITRELTILHIIWRTLTFDYSCEVLRYKEDGIKVYFYAIFRVFRNLEIVKQYKNIRG